MKQVKIEVKSLNAAGTAEEVKGSFNFAFENQRAISAVKDTAKTAEDLANKKDGKPTNGIPAHRRDKFVFPFQAYNNREVRDLVAKYGKFYMKNVLVE